MLKSWWKYVDFLSVKVDNFIGNVEELKSEKVFKIYQHLLPLLLIEIVDKNARQSAGAIGLVGVAAGVAAVVYLKKKKTK